MALPPSRESRVIDSGGRHAGRQAPVHRRSLSLGGERERAYAIHVHDTHWPLMPFKPHDPGVHVKDAGVRTDTTGQTWPVPHLSFESGIRLTSKDQYCVYLDPHTYRVGRWEFLLQNDPPAPSASVAAWNDSKQYGPVWLASNKPIFGDDVAIRFENVEVRETVPEGALP